MSSSPLFVAPLLLPRSRATAPASSPRRRAAAAPRLSASRPSTAPDDDPNNDERDARYARFSEFVAHGGNARLQDELVKEVLWAATRTATTQSMESTIQGQIDAVSDLLSELYSKSRRDMEQRNHELAIRTSLPSISKWNQQLIQRHKESKLKRSQISKELAIVDALLKRASRSRSRSRSKRKSRVTAVALDAPQQRADAVHAFARELRLLRMPNGLLFTLVLCVFAIESFENVVSQENGPSTLAQFSAFSGLLVMFAAYFHALRAAHVRALHRLADQSSPSVKARGERKR